MHYKLIPSGPPPTYSLEFKNKTNVYVFGPKILREIWCLYPEVFLNGKWSKWKGLMVPLNVKPDISLVTNQK